MKIIHLFFILFSTFVSFTWAGQSSSTSYQPVEGGSQQTEADQSQNGSDGTSQEDGSEVRADEAQAKNAEGSVPKDNPKSTKPASDVKGNNNNSHVEVPSEENSFLTSSGTLAVILIPLFSLL